ncbi:MAG: hypothetical protein AB9834_21205 [Lentimicrobium sp.]
METGSVIPRKSRPFRKILLWGLAVILVVASVAGIYLYRNFNQLLSKALLQNFNSTVISDIYELKFEKLRVNLADGDIRVINVVMQPRSNPLRRYSYINSSIRMTTRRLILEDVEIMALLKSGKLELQSIEINQPEIEVSLNGEVNKFLPYKDTSAVKENQSKNGKRFINGFSLKKFELIDASFKITDTGNLRKFSIQKLNVSLSELIIDQQTGQDFLSFNTVGLNIAEISGRLQTGGFRTLSLKDFSLNVSALEILKSADTMIFKYADFNTGFKDLNLNTADSIFNISVRLLGIYRDKKSINLEGISFKPNISHNELQKKEKYQKSQFAVSVGSINLVNVNFDTLVYHRKLFVDEIRIDKAEVSLYKDKRKPFDTNKFPDYLGQKITAIPLPIKINTVKVSEAGFVNVERKEDGKTAKVTISRGELEAKNITNLQADGLLSVNLSGYLENKAFLTLKSVFSYQKPQFSISGRVGKFDLAGLNQLLAAYSPAAIKKGIVDEISFSGVVHRTQSSGTMKFLYHDLDVDLKLTDKKWQNSVLGFAANTYLNASNPPSAEKPPRIVSFRAERDMNKGGFNIILKSILNGLKETMIMSKENKKAYKEEKKKWKLKK